VGRRSGNYPPELRERAVRMVAQVRPDYLSDWPAICAAAEKLGIGTAETLRKWARQAEVDAGTRPGVTSRGESPRRVRRPIRRSRAEMCPLPTRIALSYLTD
jgi:transposase